MTHCRQTMAALALTALLAAAVACHRSAAPDEAAMKAAEACYQRLLAGDYEGFVAGMYLPEAIPEGYRSQLVDNARMFIAEQQQEHGGMVSVEALRQTRDTIGTQPLAYAFLLVTYGDSLSEEVVVPMVEDDDGQWWMR